MQKVYYNGRFFERNEPTVPVTDRSLFFGDAVYDMMIGKGGSIHQAYEHIERLLSGAAAIRLCHKYSADDILEIVSLIVKQSGYSEYSVYVQLSRNSEKRVHSNLSANSANLLVWCDPCEINPTLHPIKLITEPDVRYELCNIKTVNLLPAVLASTKAEEAGCDEAIFYRGNTVTECAHSNIAILEGSRLITHPLGKYILPGITRKHLLIQAKALGISCIEEPFSLSRMYGADDIIITSTTKLMRYASHIDGVSVGGRASEITKALHRSLFNEYAENCHK